MQLKLLTILISVIISPIRYTHIEGECPFIKFEDLLDRLEDLVADVVDRVMSGPYAQLVKDLNPVSNPSRYVLGTRNSCMLSSIADYLKMSWIVLISSFLFSTSTLQVT